MHGIPPASIGHGYRADIDGLRALAILPVLFNHAGVKGFSGGFVGVDIFFVISGYLITAILARDIDDGRYSLVNFYCRRILRIFPALFVMIVATTLVAAFTMLPAEVKTFAQSVAATALFLSNIHFYFETDYFTLGASARPLLHTWSLAVEEQWYLFWPLILAAIGAGRRGSMLRFAIAMSAVSFLASLWLVSRDSAATFYLLPTRAWELGIGAILALTPYRLPARWLNELLALFGLGLILFSVKFYTHETEFPGLAAAAPCMGAALLIATGHARTLVRRLLEMWPVVLIGQISFSLYLWHWPVIVYTNVGLLQPNTPFTIVAMLGASFALAFLSWRFVERPFRQQASTSPPKAVLMVGIGVSIAGLAVALVFPTIAHRVSGFSPSQLALSNFVYFDGDKSYRRGVCFMVGPRTSFDAEQCLSNPANRPSLLFLGDSHGAQLWPGLSTLEPAIRVLQATATGCVASLYPEPKGYCQTFLNDALNHVLQQDNKPSAVIFASRWTPGNLPNLEASLTNPMIKAANPILVGPIPEYTTALPRLLVFADRRADPDLIGRFRNEATFSLDKEMRALAERTGTPYFSLVDFMCPGNACRTLAAPDVPMQFDYGHLTPEGSRIVAEGLVPFILTHAQGLRDAKPGG